MRHALERAAGSEMAQARSAVPRDKLMQLGVGCVERALQLCVPALVPFSTVCVASSTTTTLRPVAVGEGSRCSLAAAAAAAGAAGSWRRGERRCPSPGQPAFEARPATAR